VNELLGHELHKSDLFVICLSHQVYVGLHKYKYEYDCQYKGQTMI